MFEDNVCPMLFTDVINIYSLSEDFVKKFCEKGCSTKCGQFLKEELYKLGILQIEGQMSFKDYEGIMP